MVTTIRETTSVGERDKSKLQAIEPDNISQKITSADSKYHNSKYHSDPDLLIREYFVFASPKQRVQLRKVIAGNIKSLQSMLKILEYSRNSRIHDAYDAAVDLLAEFDNLAPLEAMVELLEAGSKLLKQSLQVEKLTALDDYWEVLIKGVAYAYRISAKERFELIQSLLASSNRRVVKATLVDALVSIAEEIDVEQIKNALNCFTSDHESDPYIRAYTEEALRDLA